MILDNKKNNFNRVKNTVHRLTHKLAIAKSVNIIVDVPTLYDAFSNASYTVQFYNMKHNQINHFKEIAHMAFWISKLKPAQVVKESVLSLLLREAGSSILGSQSSLREKESEFQRNVRAFEGFPLNEWISVSFCLHMVEIGWNQQLESISDKSIRTVFSDRIGFVRDRFVNNVANDFALSLRYHNFSARGFAMALESTFSIRTDVTNATP